MKKNLAKTYDPKDFEDRIYETWEESGAFNAEVDPDKKPFTIVMPPPNITGQLHMGHALDQTLQDVLTRWKRMEGYSALWLPGSDHASIATEVKVANKLYEDTGKHKSEFTREEFLEHAWAWKEEYGSRITKQCRKLGDSCDWRRERFTMDEGCNKAVTKFFIDLYNKGWIYRGNRLINWCPSCKTSLSDAEVEHEDENGKYWYFRYPAVDGGEGIVVATSRPETMFGDIAIAVHPSDERYKDLVGKNVYLPILNREIPVIADEYPNPEKGTGAVKITPAHDPNDFEVGARHDLEILSCMNDDATMNELAGKYEGMDRYECRKAWVKELEEAGYLVKTEDMVIPVGKCYRCHNAIEPMLSDQWFVKMEELAKPAIEAATSGELEHIPARFEKIYLNWLNDIHDWCISRQLWWGHQIPAFYCDACGEMVVTKEDHAVCPKCGKPMRQDPDTLDTWFSSALWPFSTLGWPDNTEELKYFYPTNTLVTGYDIIFFWVVRMMFSGLKNMGEVPFDTVLIHGLVRDEQGRKMSKSLGNGIDPLKVIDEYGADALRFMLATGNAPGNDMRYSDDKVKAARNFANKLWNASRFIMMNLPENFQYNGLPEDLELEDRWIVSKFNAVAKEVGENLDKFEIGVASAKIYDFIWDVYCDWYIELTKPRIQADGATMEKAQAVLVWVMRGMLKLLHPFMPYITEEIWQVLTGGESMIIVESYPVYDAKYDYADAAQFEKVIDAIRAIRNRRTEMQVPPSKKARVCIETTEPELYRSTAVFFEKLASASAVEVGEKFEMPDAATAVTDSVRIFIPMDELIDKDKELARLKKEQEKVQKDLDFLSKKLSNQGFLAKAPEKLVEAEKAKLAKAQEKMDKIMQSMAALQ